jgi:hypothetical protein
MTDEMSTERLIEHENPCLNKKQINYAISEIEERHKLKETPLRVVWPFVETFFGMCLPKRKTSFKVGLKKAIRNKIGLKVPKSDARVDNDPYLLLGYGMNSYFQIMIQLMWLCILICIVAIPLMSIYATGTQFEGLNAYSLGNLGGSSVSCTQAPISFPKSSLAIGCPSGTFIDVNAVGSNDHKTIYSAGIVNTNEAQLDVCADSVMNQETSCTPYLRSSTLSSAIKTQCQGERACEIQDLQQYLYSLSGAPSGCNEDLTQMFVQVACLVPGEEIVDRQLKGLVLACCAVFISLFVINYLDYVKKLQENNYIEWDIKTITAGDYTVEFDIAPSFFQKYVEQEWPDWDQKQRENGIEYVTEQEGFKDWVCATMEARLDRMPDQGLEDEPVEHIKVAKATMAFKNAEVIKLLRERGTAIKTEQWDKQTEVEKKINELKGEKLSELTTPCSLFLTFENEEGIARALKYDEAVEADPGLADCKHWLGDEVIEIQPASEPSDIIWENRAFTPT